MLSLLRAPFAVLALASATLLAPQDAENDAWQGAMALKTAGKNAEAASAFETFLQTYPASAHASQAEIECGVCWFGLARARQVLHRNTPASIETFAKAESRFTRVADGRPTAPEAARARYMCGSTRLFLGDLAGAEKQYSQVIESYRSDEKYFPKSLERRATVRRHLLQTSRAIEDLRAYQTAAPKGEDAKSVAHCLRVAPLFERAAPALDVQAWVQGEPRRLETHYGQVVGLFFFGSWCTNCAKERDFVLDLARRYEPKGLQLIGIVGPTQGETVATAADYCKKYAIEFPVMMDTGKTTRSYSADSLPYLVLIDREGRVRWIDNPGGLLDATLELLLDAK
jgi:tetratricopeptide (TPR) repeat protein